MRARLGWVAVATTGVACGRIGFAPLADGADGDDAGGRSIDLGADGVGVADTYLHSSSPTLNYGTQPLIEIGSGDRLIIRFDTSAIPADATVIAAVLRLVPMDSGDISGDHIDLFGLVEAWDELAATWNMRLSAVPWTVAGADGASHDPVRMGSLAIADVVPNVASSIELDPIRVGTWVSDPTMNDGLVLDGAPAHVHFMSREATDPALRPRLVVMFR